MKDKGFAEPAEIQEILNSSKVIAVVGLSDKPDRPSFGVAKYLQQAGYTIIPVNPTKNEILGEKVYPDLGSIPVHVDVIDVFRKSEMVGPVVEEAMAIRAEALWLQEGVINIEAARKARQAGLKVVMDRCMLKEHKKRVP